MWYIHEKKRSYFSIPNAFIGFHDLFTLCCGCRQTNGSSPNGWRNSLSWYAEWNCAIGENSNRKVSISGETITYEAVDYLDVEVFLQCWNGSDWVNVTSRIYKNRDSFYVSGSDFITVSKGYSYRCKAIHTARTAGSNDHIKTSVSNAIMIQ